MCGDSMLTSEDLFCYRCKGDAAKLGAKREIYDNAGQPKSQDRFSELFVDGLNNRNSSLRYITKKSYI